MDRRCRINWGVAGQKQVSGHTGINLISTWALKIACDECHRIIGAGEIYTRYTGTLLNVCKDCDSLLRNLTCVWNPGELWHDVRTMLESNQEPPSAECMVKLTKKARDKVCDILEEIWG